MADPVATSSEFTRTPKLLKGAIAVYRKESPNETPQLIVFQYNPDQVKRTLAARTPPKGGGGGNAGAQREDVLRVFGPPIETIQMSVVLSATDQYQTDLNAQRQDIGDGLHPALATLELLMYPPSSSIQAASDRAAKGAVQVAQASVPLTLLVWGKSRVVPIMLTSFSVSEEAFDDRLNPIEAKIDVGLRVLTYIEFLKRSMGRDAFKAYHSSKEKLAAKYAHGFDEQPIRGLLPPLGQA
jgi:hypothetical protein